MLEKILNELLQRGHQVSAIVRNTDKVVQSENVKAVSADVLDEASISNAVKGHDAVVSAYMPDG